MLKKSLLKCASLMAVAALVVGFAAPVQAADVKFRLSTVAQPNSDAHKFLLDFAKQAGERTGGRVEIKVYPANQLGDWDEVHELVMQGAVDMAMQSLSTKFDQGLALAWFPYTTLDYESSKKAFSSGGLIYNIVDGLIAKNQGGGDFEVPNEILQAVHAEPELAETTVCFLADGDTTGGNSGSPVVDGKGRLVGLNFDRVFENVSGDFGWNADRSRNISVDMQYVLWLMRDIWPSPRLLKEMGVD